MRVDLHEEIVYNPKQDAASALLRDPSKKFVMLYGGSRCFAGDQVVALESGERKRIDMVEPGDLVLTKNLETGEIEHQPVIKRHCYPCDKRMIRVRLADGSLIIASEDHLFWRNGGWHTLKSVLEAEAPGKRSQE